MEIKQATINDVDKMSSFLDGVKLKQNVLGLQGEWSNYLPVRNQLLEKISTGEEFYAEEEGKIVGIITLGKKSKGYVSVNWAIQAARPLYITWVVVDGNYDEKGVEKKLMLFAEDMAKKKGAECLRIDAYLTNVQQPKFYVGLGYKKIGEETYNSKEKSFICYEKDLR